MLHMYVWCIIVCKFKYQLNRSPIYVQQHTLIVPVYFICIGKIEFQKKNPFVDVLYVDQRRDRNRTRARILVAMCKDCMPFGRKSRHAYCLYASV